MNEDLVAQARAERARSYADLERTADQTLTLYSTWRERDGLTEPQIRARLKWAPPVGADAVELFQQLTTVGASPDTAAEVASQAAAARQVRVQVGAPEQAEAVRAAFDALTDRVAAGGDQAAAAADFREAVAGWRGDGYAEGPLGQPVMVAFDDGTVVPDGVELAGVRETGARHSILTPSVQAGIDAYLIARAEGLEYETAVDIVGNGPGVRGAVAQFAADVEYYEVDVTTARDAAVASIIADAALGQFLSLRNAGRDIDQAAAVAAGGDPVAVHAIAGFIARVRDGFPEEVAEPDAWAAAVAAARFRGEDYRGSIPEGFELPGFEDAHRTARAALDAHITGTAPADPGGVGAAAVSRFERLTRHGMDPEEAARLAAADTAEQQARMRVRDEFNVLDAAHTVIRDLQHELETADHDEESDDDGSGPDAPGQAEAEQLAFDSTYDVAESAVRLFEQVRRSGRDAADARRDVLATFHDDDAAVAGAALDRYSDHRGAGYDHDTARGLASQETAERLTPRSTTEDPGAARSIPDTSTSEAVLDDPPVREEDEEMAAQDDEQQHAARDGGATQAQPPMYLTTVGNYHRALDALTVFERELAAGADLDAARAAAVASRPDHRELVELAVEHYERGRDRGVDVSRAALDAAEQIRIRSLGDDESDEDTDDLTAEDDGEPGPPWAEHRVGPPRAGSMAAREQDRDLVAAVAAHVAECGNEDGNCGMCNDYLGTDGAREIRAGETTAELTDDPPVREEDVAGERAASAQPDRADGFELGDVVRDRSTGEVFTVTGDAAGWDPSEYESAENAPGPEAPERAPEPGSWIARNLIEHALDPTSVAALEAERTRVHTAVNALPAGLVTDGDLARVGIDRDDFDRVTREQDELVHAEEWAQASAEWKRAARTTAMGRDACSRGRTVADDAQQQADDRDDGTRRSAGEVLHLIDEVLAAEDADPPPLGERVAACGQAVDAAEHAVQQADIAGEDTARAERCARWNAEDQAADAAADDNDGRELA